MIKRVDESLTDFIIRLVEKPDENASIEDFASLTIEQ